MKLAVVFDTSVLFSAIGWSGKPSQCVQLARDGQIEGVTCTEIMDELAYCDSKNLTFRASDRLFGVIMQAVLHTPQNRKVL